MSLKHCVTIRQMEIQQILTPQWMIFFHLSLILKVIRTPVAMKVKLNKQNRAQTMNLTANMKMKKTMLLRIHKQILKRSVKMIIRTFSNDNEDVNVTDRKLGMRNSTLPRMPHGARLVVHTSFRTSFAAICRLVVNVSMFRVLFSFFLGFFLHFVTLNAYGSSVNYKGL